MKKTILTLTLAFAATIAGLAQQKNTVPTATPTQGVSLPGFIPNLRKGIQISVRGGYDIVPMFSFKEDPKKLQVAKLKGGLYSGTGVDYYWDWIGVGADFDFVKNPAGFTDETYEYFQGKPGDYKVVGTGITRLFYGAGPSFRYLTPDAAFSTELNTRVGLGSVKGGKSSLMSGSTTFAEFLGFEANNVLSFKSQLRFTYFVSPVVGISWGGYYLHHTKVKSLGEKRNGLEVTGERIGDYSSIGAFAGVTFRIAPPPPAPPRARQPKQVENLVINGMVVVCGTKQPIDGVTVVVTEKKNGQEKILTSNSRGEFSFVVTPSSELTIYGKKANYFSQVITLGPRDIKRYQNVQLEICMERADCDESVRLDNIHYDLDKYDIRPDARPELDRLVRFLRDNPEVRVELSSHTDSRASHEYNQRLSQNRANSARNYIISQGIDPSRVISVGYGETRLLNHCSDGVRCTEAEHQLNRRTEMKVICPK